MILLKQADVYAPESLGIRDVLICGGRIEAIGEELQGGTGCRVIDAGGMRLTPGLVDQHQHITGGGGEGGFHTRTPQIRLSSIIRSGITTVLGLLGTDDVSRSVEDLVAGAKALQEEGISAYALCGAYGYPSVTITGTVKKDIAFIKEIIGVKLALSDHRAPGVTTDELIRLGSDVRTAGMLSGKAGIVVLHMGSGRRQLDQVFEALERTEIPVKTFHPTHVARDPGLLESSFKLAKMGGYIDITCEPESKEKMLGVLDSAKRAGVPMDRLTFSSDGQGSWSNYDSQGRLLEMGVTDVGNMYTQLVQLVNEGGFSLSQALTYFTSNVARALELYPRKGCICPGADGDLLLIRRDMTLDTVLARGAVMMEGGRLLAGGTYETVK